MATNDIRQFIWYPQYIVQPQDMTGLQQYLRATSETSMEGLTGAAILSGMRPSAAGGMNVSIGAGIAASAAGRLAILQNDAQVTVASDPALPTRTLVVARPSLTNVDSIIEPLNPPTVVPFTQRLDMSLVVIPGTPAASPSYPSKQAGDIVLLGLLIPAAAASVSVTDFEIGPREVPKKAARKIREASVSFTAASGEGQEDTIEFDATAASGVIALPPASVMLGREITVMKIDSTANIVQVLPNGGETLSGQPNVELDTQWQSVRMYAHKNTWRIV